MTMSDERNFQDRLPIVAHLILPVLMKPILRKLERRNSECADLLMSALIKAESTSPGILYEVINGFMIRADLPVDMTESLLRLQGMIPENEEYRIRRNEEPFQELNRKASSLRRILAKIPDEIDDRKTFLETIKEIASAIKKLLDCVNIINNYASNASDRQLLENRRRDFIRYSKRFSNTLKEFFKEGQPSTVFTAAAHLIHRTNLLQMTIRIKIDYNS